MNPTIKLSLVILIAFEISFTQVWTVNLALLIVSLLLMIYAHVSLKRLLWLTAVPLFSPVP
ncbi:hypothetical protein L3X07_00875 [Levilactobacillus brevis]|nr:hypothetical protein [Levilactobacillus brevis]